MCAKRSSQQIVLGHFLRVSLRLIDCDIHTLMWHICIKLVFRRNNRYTFYAFIPWCILLISWLLHFWREYIPHMVMCYWICAIIQRWLQYSVGWSHAWLTSSVGYQLKGQKFNTVLRAFLNVDCSAENFTSSTQHYKPLKMRAQILIKKNVMMDMQMTHVSYNLNNFSTDMSSIIGDWSHV